MSHRSSHFCGWMFRQHIVYLAHCVCCSCQIKKVKRPDNQHCKATCSINAGASVEKNTLFNIHITKNCHEMSWTSRLTELTKRKAERSYEHGFIKVLPKYLSELLCVSSAKVYIDRKLKRNADRDPDDLIGDILHQSNLSKKELYAAITELQIGGVETVSNTTKLYFLVWRSFWNF